MPNVSASVVAGFPASVGSGGGLLIEHDPGFYTGIDAHLRISPPATAISIVTNIGSVRTGSTKPVPVQGGILRVSGSNVANLPRRVGDTAPEFQVLSVFDAATGIATTVNYHYNALTNELRLSKPVHAAIAYSSYLSRAQELIYTPEVSGLSLRYGVIAAFAPPDDLVVHEVDLTQVDSGNSEFEIYRITSPVVGNGTGTEYEKPPGYPTSGAYTTPPVVFTLELEGTFMTKRVHEIGLMDALGRAWVRTFFRSNLEPYIGNPDFAPTKTLETSTLPQDRFDKNLILKAKNIIASRGQGVL